MSETAVLTTTGNGSAEAHYEARRLVKMKELKNAVGALTSERDAARAERDKAVKELGEFKGKSDSSALKKQNDELKQQLRTTKHRHTFDELAKERGANPKALDTLYEKSGWKAEEDEFSEDEMGATIDAVKERHDYLFQVTADAPVKTIKPGAATGQAKPVKKAAGTDDQDILREGDPRLNDAAWMMKNMDKVVASAQERLRRGELDGWMEGDHGIDGRGAHGQTLTV